MDDVEKAKQRQREERQRKRELLGIMAFALLRRLVNMAGDGELEYDAFGERYCLFCYADPTGEHEPECIYAAAVRLLRELEGT